MTPRLVFVVARARNGVIGDRGQMPWRIKSEMALFKRLTMGKPCLMGRKTWDGLYVKPLPGRPCLVLTRDKGFRAEGAEAFHDFAPMLSRAQAIADRTGAEEIAIIGGAALFDLALPHAERMYLTEIGLDAQGDILFPAFDEALWEETAFEPGGGADGEPQWRLRVLDRRTG
jgi:dihydrofolate reductase